MAISVYAVLKIAKMLKVLCPDGSHAWNKILFVKSRIRLSVLQTETDPGAASLQKRWFELEIPVTVCKG